MKKQKKTQVQMVRQGDVLIVPVEALPTKLENARTKDGRIILAYGEVTGHAHEIKDVDAADWWKDSKGNEFLDVKKTAVADHQEHASVTLAPGQYEVRHQVEYTPEELKRVAD